MYRECLPNGVTLLVVPVLGGRVAAQVTLVRAGFLDEPDELVGISHVLEHMLFKGTPTLAPGELAQRTKTLGGDLNAWTSYDRTVYYATMPARHAREVGRLQADQVQRPLLDPNELRRELGVIVQEVRRKRDSPGAMASETLHRLLYAEHRIRRWRIGEEADLERLTSPQVRAYYDSRYRPERTIVARVGGTDPEAALDDLRADWGAWQAPAAASIDPAPREVTCPVGQVAVLPRDVTRADLVLGWRAPASRADEVPALELAAAVLTLGRGAQLQRQLRDDGLVGGVGAGHYGAGDVGVWALAADGDPKHLDAMLIGVGRALRVLHETSLPVDEIARARTLLQARWHRSLERVESRALALVDAELRGDVTWLEQRDAGWDRVTPDSLRAAVRQWLSPAAVAGVVAVPMASSVTFTAEQVQACLAQVPHWQSDVVPPLVLRAGRSPGRPTSRAGVAHLALGGLDLLAARHGQIPQVVLAWYGPPPLTASAETAGHQALLLRSLLRGTLMRNSAALATTAERLGGMVAPLLSHDAMGFSLTVLADRAPEAVTLLAELVTAPRLAEADVAIERSLLIDDARAITDDMVRFPIQLMLAGAFADQGYGAPLYGTPASLAECDETVLRRNHATWLAGGRSTLVAVGPGDPVALVESLAAALGGWSDPLSAGVEPESVTIRPVLREVARIREQSAVAMLLPGPSRRDPQRSAAEVWAAMAGGLGGVLFESLRSRRSLAYSVMASSWQRRSAGGLLTYIATAPERLAEARAAMREELATMAATLPAADALDRARHLLAGQAEVARQSAGAVVGDLFDAWRHGDDLAALADPGGRYRVVTGDDVHAVLVDALASPGPAEGVVQAAGAGSTAS